jgi:hypothetical protein
MIMISYKSARKGQTRVFISILHTFSQGGVFASSASVSFTIVFTWVIAQAVGGLATARLVNFICATLENLSHCFHRHFVTSCPLYTYWNNHARQHLQLLKQAGMHGTDPSMFIRCCLAMHLKRQYVFVNCFLRRPST